jgi:hypothetical protein
MTVVFWARRADPVADDDSGVFGGAWPYRLSLKNSFNSAAALVSPTAE